MFDLAATRDKVVTPAYEPSGRLHYSGEKKGSVGIEVFDARGNGLFGKLILPNGRALVLVEKDTHSVFDSRIHMEKGHINEHASMAERGP